MLPGQFLYTEGKYDGRYGRQPLGDSCHREAHGCHEHLHQRTAVAQADDEDDATHHEAYDSQCASQLVEPHLHGGALFGYRFYHGGYLAYL